MNVRIYANTKSRLFFTHMINASNASRTVFSHMNLPIYVTVAGRLFFTYMNTPVVVTSPDRDVCPFARRLVFRCMSVQIYGTAAFLHLHECADLCNHSSSSFSTYLSYATAAGRFFFTHVRAPISGTSRNGEIYVSSHFDLSSAVWSFRFMEPLQVDFCSITRMLRFL